MAPKLSLEAKMTIKELSRRGWTNQAMAETLGVTEGAIRYHRRRQAEGAADGRSKQRHLAAGWSEPIEAWLASRRERAPLNLAALHEHLVSEHEYPGSLRSVQRYYRAHYPPPQKRARRRVETPPGSQAQADWAEFRGVVVGRQLHKLYAFHLQLSHSRYAAVVWSERKDQLSWQTVHNGALERLAGVPAIIRVDNDAYSADSGHRFRAKPATCRSVATHGARVG
jgi:transposase